MISATPDAGYRVEGWYKCVYDEESDCWYTTDEKITNSENSYSDEIIQAHYNDYLGKYYLEGKGTKQDYEEAFKLYKVAHEQGNLEATKNLANCYKTGKGVSKNQEEANRLLQIIQTN